MFNFLYELLENRRYQQDLFVGTAECSKTRLKILASSVGVKISSFTFRPCNFSISLRAV